jgi:zinc and cadmium transporter
MYISLIIILVVIFAGILGLSGGLFIIWKEKLVRPFIGYLISFAAGTMLGAAFLDLLPESIEGGGNVKLILAVTLLGILIFFLIEKFLIWYHCHDNTDCEVHGFTYLIILSDSIHNFIDGAIIATSFLVSLPLGITTSLAIIAHEIPQEIGDFGILLHGGMPAKKVLLYNFFSALFGIFGALLILFFSFDIIRLSSLIIAFAAGNFIYIASSDLIPAIHKEIKIKKALTQVFFMILGVLVIWLTGNFLH